MKLLLPILLLSSTSVDAAFHAPSSVAKSNRMCQLNTKTWGSNHGQPCTSPSISALRAKAEDNKAMAFLRKVGRVGGAANMDFANAMGLDESPSGGAKSSYHEDGTFKVSNWIRMPS